MPSSSPERRNTSHIGWFKLLANPAIVRRALITMLIVGTLLNLINQYDRIFGTSSLNWISFMLTFAVPYCVASVSGAMALHAVNTQLASKSPEV